MWLIKSQRKFSSDIYNDEVMRKDAESMYVSFLLRKLRHELRVVGNKTSSYRERLPINKLTTGAF